MGFLDSILGRSKAAKQVTPDNLFAITTAAIDLATAQNIVSTGEAAVVFQPLATGDFQSNEADVTELLTGIGAETGTTIDIRSDSFGYRWFVLKDPDVDDQAVAVNTVMESLRSAGYADRVLCAVFAFSEEPSGRVIDLIYLAKRGSWYPFVPLPGATKERDREREMQLQGILGKMLPLEAEVDRWYPLWDAPVGGRAK